MICLESEVRMSEEWNDWILDADDSDVETAYYRAIDNGWFREAELYKQELNKRGLTCD